MKIILNLEDGFSREVTLPEQEFPRTFVIRNPLREPLRATSNEPSFAIDPFKDGKVYFKFDSIARSEDKEIGMYYIDKISK